MRAGLALAVTWSVVASALLPSGEPCADAYRHLPTGAALSLGSLSWDLRPAREGRTPLVQRASLAGYAGVRSSRGGAAPGRSVAGCNYLTQARS